MGVKRKMRVDFLGEEQKIKLPGKVAYKPNTKTMAPISKTFQMKLSSLFSTAKLIQAYKLINRYNIYFSNSTFSLSR